MTEPEFQQIDCGAVRLNVATYGDPAKPPLIALHGFPEFWFAWSDVARRLAGDYFVILPDQRGFNLSDKPDGHEAYRAGRMVEDLAVLAERYSPDRPFILAGHDWGASIAYAFAFAHPDRLTHLVIANGMHPVCFQRALLSDPDQAQASQYFHKLRADGAAALMAENNFRRTMKMLEGFSKADWMTEDIKANYRAAWAQPGAIEAMLHWYSSSPILVPMHGEHVTHAPLLDVPRERVLVRMPHLVIWGEADEALRPSCLDGLDEFAADLSIHRIPDAGHWILHEKPNEVSGEIREFLGANASS